MLLQPLLDALLAPPAPAEGAGTGRAFCGRRGLALAAALGLLLARWSH